MSKGLKQIHMDALEVIEAEPGITRQKLTENLCISPNAVHARLRMLLRHGAISVKRLKVFRTWRLQYFSTGKVRELPAVPINCKRPDRKVPVVEFTEANINARELRSKAESLGWFDPNRYRQPEARA